MTVRGALNKLTIGGCPKQAEGKRDALNKMTLRDTLNKLKVGGCPKQDEGRGMP